MIEFLNSSISINSLFWLFLVAFMLHDFEEIIRIEPWYRRHYDRIMSRVPINLKQSVHSFSQITSSQFAVAVCIEFIVFVPFTFLAAERGNYLFFLGFNVVLFLHVFMHIGQALYVKMLVPGVITAVMITLPYSIYLFYRLLNENIVTVMDILKSLPVGLLLIPIILFGHKMGESLSPMKQVNKKMSDEKAIILFDGVCNFCNSSVQFIINRDRAGYFRFASLQSDVGKSLLAMRPDLQNLDSIVLIENGKYFTESSAALRIARKLAGFWKLAFLFNAIPKVCRDPFYRYFARNRYRWFGKQEACMIPTAEMRARFLSDE